MNASSGYIALVSVIIISALLLIIATSAGFTGFFGRFSILDSEYKERSLALAEACGDAALLKLSSDPGYAPPGGGEQVPVAGSDVCTILSVTNGPLAGQQTIETQALFPSFSGKQSHSYIEIVITSSNLAVVCWAERQNTTSHTCFL